MEDSRLTVNESIEKLSKFFGDTYISDILENFRRGNRFLVADFRKISEFDPELADAFLESPVESLAVGVMAINELANCPDEERRKTELHISNLPESQKVRVQNIRSATLMKLISIEGIVKKAGKVHPRVTHAKFECPSCGAATNIAQTKRVLTSPDRCACGRKGKMRCVSQRLIDIQRIQLEEVPELINDTNSASQKVYCYIEGQLTDPSLIGKIRPGNRVVLTGILEMMPDFYKKDKDPQDAVMIDVMIKINYVETVQKEYEEIDLSEEDKKEIIEFSKDPRLMDKFVNSVAPTIYGLKNIKETLILQLLGGVTKHRADNTISRGWFHVLLCGDPSTAKSKLLEYMKNVAPKSRFAVGGSTSSAGITATVIRDEMSGIWELEAGAMVLAHKGILLLDEMDKMSNEDRASLHEGMEAGTITKTKAGINATLPAQTSILAVANPKYGRFDPYEPIIKQINIPPALFSRFDMIFVIKDNPDVEKDFNQTEHILRSHQKPKLIEPELDSIFVRKYLAYAKQNIHPFLSDPAIGIIQTYFLKLRNSAQSDDASKSISITYRQLDALVRLSEASAKLRLSGVVEKQDAEKAITLVEYFMECIGLDPQTGKLDMDIIHSGISTSKRNRIHILKETLKILVGEFGKIVPLDELIKRVQAKTEINESDLEDIIEQMKKYGEVYEPRRGFISIVE